MSIKNKLSNLYAKAGIVATTVVLSATASASESNIFQPLIDQIDVSSVKTGILTVAGVVIGVTVIVMGINKVRAMIR
ncbi:hypothetical protein AM202_04392 [Actinobacillus minor 202]|uniref:Phage-related membrane protein n=1 Tax=Actinobacillus minor 202 TaxID=591023 RepID=A0ABM9YVN4_9PAST|nr:hypothetical protein [Actinobacillus minor]EEV25432.1 hypothetical protein AM202_04392 [Actinobacillus minor 202]